MLPKFKKFLVILSTVRRTITELQLDDKIKLRIIDEKKITLQTKEYIRIVANIKLINF